MYLEPRGMGVRHEVGGLAEVALGIAWNDVGFFRADTRRVACNGLESGGGCHLRIAQVAAA